MFMQSQTYFGADSLIHAFLMRYLDRNHLEVHVAVNYGNKTHKSTAYQALEGIPDLHIRPTNFGPTITAVSKVEVAKSTFLGAAPALMSMTGLARYIKKHEIDIIHGTEKPRDAFYGLLLARLTGTRSITHLHVKVEDWISPLVRWAMKHNDGLIGVSDFVKQSIIAMGYLEARTFSVLNGMDLSGWEIQTNGQAIRDEFAIAPQTPTLAVVSRLFHWKGHTELLKALAKVKQYKPNFKLLLVGEDDPRVTPGRGSYMSELKALTHELGLTEQIIFTGFRKDVSQILAACDIFAMPSFEEPFGMVYLEAMAMNRPVIALDNGGTREVVEHGKSGLLSLPQDIDTLAANILTLINDPELRVRMGAYGRTRVENYFNPVRMSQEVEQVYRQILGM
jgi:glycosyltransferase involved in cell wall biosynthesis